MLTINIYLQKRQKANLEFSQIFYYCQTNSCLLYSSVLVAQLRDMFTWIDSKTQRKYRIKTTI